MELNPLEYGWEKDKNTQLLVPVMMTQSPAAPELLNDIVCECLNACVEKCICYKNSQPCTAACSCEQFEVREEVGDQEDMDLPCQNPNRVVFEEEIDISDSEEESE